MSLEDVRALTCDVFGAVRNWRGSVIAAGEELGARTGFETDWPSFRDEWRFDSHIAGMRGVRDSEVPWMPVDQLRCNNFDELLAARGIDSVTEDAVADFNRAWHRLQPWPDVPEGLDRLRTKYIVSTLSNGNVARLTNMASTAVSHGIADRRRS